MTLEARIQYRVGALSLDVELRLERGVGAITGATASGKSTLLQILAGVLRPESAAVSFGGTTWQDGAQVVPAFERRVGWVPQDSLLFPHLSVRDNLGFAGAGKAEVNTLAGELGVENLLHRFPRHLSGGEKQRVALGRALISKSQLLLLDEPFSALDGAMREQVIAVVRARLGERMLILVSHQEISFQDWAARIWHLHDGKLAVVS